MRARLRRSVAGTLFAFYLTAWACIPEFPPSYLLATDLWFGRAGNIVAMPEASFSYEMSRSFPREDGKQLIDTPQRVTESSDLVTALVATGMPEAEATKVSDSVRALDNVVNAYPFGAKTPRTVEIPKVPKQFALYWEGAICYFDNKPDAAIDKWKQLLALPVKLRTYRSVHAAYMMAITLMETEPAKAIEFFMETRALADAGMKDCCDLARASVGWQARAEYRSGDFVSSLHHYLALYQSSDGREHEIGLRSLRMVIPKAMASSDAIVSMANDVTCREIIGAWLVSHPAAKLAARDWLAVLGTIDVKSDVPRADRLAWAAYSAGDMEAAQRWLGMASAATPYGQWVRSKLLLRDGRIDEAMALLRELAQTFPESETWRNGYLSVDQFSPPSVPCNAVKAELGVLLLGRQDYVGALDMLLRAGYWVDAAYIADRVLSTAELKQYVDDHAADTGLDAPLGYAYGAWNDTYTRWEENPTTRKEALRYLLARRLARANDWAGSMKYWPDRLLDTVHEFTAIIAKARPAEQPATEQSFWEWFIGVKPRTIIDRDRAKSLYAAAELIRAHGMELTGTETGPDWNVFGGSYAFPPATQRDFCNLKIDWSYYDAPKPGDDRAIRCQAGLAGPAFPEALSAAFRASADETERANRNAPEPDERYRYRYFAADLMWQSAQCLPDNDLDTMRALYQGGSYLKARDPIRANRFYRSLVWRNLNMSYAQTADKLRWFPEDPPE